MLAASKLLDDAGARYVTNVRVYLSGKCSRREVNWRKDLEERMIANAVESRADTEQKEVKA